MNFRFTCDCEDKCFIVDLVRGWEAWNVHSETGEIMGLEDSGNDGWANLRCLVCGKPVIEEAE